MTDSELAEYLHLTLADAAIVIPKLTPEKRAVYDRMKQFETDLFLWENGLGPMPGGVLVDFDRKAFR